MDVKSQACCKWHVGIWIRRQIVVFSWLRDMLMRAASRSTQVHCHTVQVQAISDFELVYCLVLARSIADQRSQWDDFQNIDVKIIPVLKCSSNSTEYVRVRYFDSISWDSYNTRAIPSAIKIFTLHHSDV